MGADEAMISTTAGLYLSVSAKTLMLSITANGSLYADVTIYRCDAYPETIKGLVRPFALLSIGSSLWNALRSRSEFM